MVTALDDPLEWVRGLEAGADDFLTRPIDDNSLIARLRSLLRLKAMCDELHLRLATSRDFGILPPSQDAEPGERVRITVIDDNAKDAERVRSALGADHDVVVITDPSRAMEQLLRSPSDLAIVNVAMRSYDGLRLCSMARTNEATRQLSLLVLVDEDSTERLVKGFELGVNDYVRKPLDTCELKARVRN